MNQNPLVSVITIVFNGEKNLQQTIDSVAAQTYKNIEYIVVDGQSTDRTVDIIKANAHMISKWISERDNGISEAFNKGIKLCSGDIIGLVNSDDWLEPDTVALAVQNMEGADVVYGEVQLWINEKPVKKTNSDHTRLRLGMTVAHPASFVRKDVYERLGGFKIDYKIAMDYDLFLRFYQNGVKFKHIYPTLSNMRMGGVSDNRRLKSLKEEVRIRNEYYNWITNAYFFIRQYAIFVLKGVLKIFKRH